MSEANKAVLKRWLSAFNQGKTAALAILDEVVTPDYRMHDPSGEVSGTQAMREYIGSLFDGLPDLRSTIEEMVSEGDRVAYRFTIRGTHKGPLMGFAPTGNLVQSTITSIARIANGRVAEEWQTWDFHDFLQQLSSAKLSKRSA